MNSLLRMMKKYKTFSAGDENSQLVIPAQAGTHFYTPSELSMKMGPRLRGDDNVGGDDSVYEITFANLKEIFVFLPPAE